jgi:acyl dehydratase
MKPTMPLILGSLQELNSYVGKEIATTGWLRMTQERIQQFAEITGDTQWIHVDAERARQESPYGATIAHGFLTLSLATHFLREAVQLPPDVRQVINYGLNRVRFPAPVRAGEKIRARIVLQSFRDLSGSAEAIFDIAMEVENSAKPCCVAEWIVRYFY